MSKILVAMSGGVDSSLTAALLHSEGHEVTGVTLKVWQDKKKDEACATGPGLNQLEGRVEKKENSCCGAEAMADARAVARTMGFPYYVLNYEDTFRANVIDGFVKEYLAGRTPNPCIACNDKVKFDPLLKTAMGLGVDSLATGHYARIDQTADGRWRLLKAADGRKDQTYFLYRLGQDQLSRLLFPLGHMTKDEVRAQAAAFNLPTAQKPESMDICFVPDGNYGKLVAQAAPQAMAEGPVLDRQGNEVGRHQGIAFYTVGQRRGLGTLERPSGSTEAATAPSYVVALDAARNAVIVGDESDLMKTRLEARSVSWVAGKAPAGPCQAMVKIRSGHPGAKATVFPRSGGVAIVEFESPQRALTPGQAAVFYDGDECLGGGIIES